MARSKRIPQVEPNQADGTIASPAPPPDDGLTAWLQVLCMHFVFFNSWGVSNGFSVFEQLYTETLSQDASTISWIGSVQVSLLFFMGVVAGRATDAGYFRIVYSTGVLLQVFGFFMLSLCDKYWQIFLAQAVCMGLGNGLTFSPGLSVMSSYFARHRAVAVGIAAAGAATGGMVYPVIINQMIYEQHVGFGWTVRAAGLVMLVTQGIDLKPHRVICVDQPCIYVSVMIILFFGSLAPLLDNPFRKEYKKIAERMVTRTAED